MRVLRIKNPLILLALIPFILGGVFFLALLGGASRLLLPKRKERDANTSPVTHDQTSREARREYIDAEFKRLPPDR